MSAITAPGITYTLTIECSCDKNHFHRYNVAKQHQTKSINSRYHIDEDFSVAERQKWKRHPRQQQHRRHHIRQPSNRKKNKTQRRNRNVYRNVVVPDGD